MPEDQQSDDQQQSAVTYTVTWETRSTHTAAIAVPAGSVAAAALAELTQRGSTRLRARALCVDDEGRPIYVDDELRGVRGHYPLEQALIAAEVDRYGACGPPAATRTITGVETPAAGATDAVPAAQTGPRP